MIRNDNHTKYIFTKNIYTLAYLPLLPEWDKNKSPRGPLLIWWPTIRFRLHHMQREYPNLLQSPVIRQEIKLKYITNNSILVAKLTRSVLRKLRLQWVAYTYDHKITYHTLRRILTVYSTWTSHHQNRRLYWENTRNFQRLTTWLFFFTLAKKIKNPPFPSSWSKTDG